MQSVSWWPAYVGLGSNLDEPRRQVLDGFARLEDLPETRLVARSSLYASPPMGPVAQPDFVNAVAGLLTRLGPAELLHELHGIEAAMGRAPSPERWGPRRIDFDLLVHGTARMDDPRLTIPHAGLADRGFVLEPLAEIAPDLDVPGRGRVKHLLAALGTTNCQRLAA
jgi:2-amino-4-hydroxy-6-hydroxymethyldihydropteridine diphosphokinase